MAPQMLDTNFVLNLRQFSKFILNSSILNNFNGNSLRSLKTGNFKSCHDYFKQYTNFQEDISKDNFLEFCFLIFDSFKNMIFMDAELHLDKDNYCIMDCLNRILSPNVNSSEYLNEEQLDVFRIIHSKMVSVFSLTGDSIMETFFNNKFNEKLDNMMRNKSQVDNGLDKEVENFLKSDDIGRKIRRTYNKILRYTNHLSIFEFHKEHKTRPRNFFFCEFPRPFFQESESYVEKHNELIEKCQDEFTKLITNELEERKNQLENDILKLKEEIQ